MSEPIEQYQTSEKIKIDYEIAGVPSRILAFVIDTAIQYALFFILYILAIAAIAGTLALPTSLIDTNNEAYLIVLFVILGVGFLAILFYRIIFEVLWRGQTPGKRIIKIRIINENGSFLSFFQVILRNVFLIIDLLPFTGMTGIIVMLINKKNKRIGDLVAGTIVIKEHVIELPDIGKNDLYVNYFAGVENINELFTDKDKDIIKLYYRTRKNLSKDATVEVIDKIVTLIENKTGVRCTSDISKENFIDSLYSHFT